MACEIDISTGRYPLTGYLNAVAPKLYVHFSPSDMLNEGKSAMPFMFARMRSNARPIDLPLW